MSETCFYYDIFFCYSNALITQQKIVQVILLCVWAERAILGSDKTALKFKYEI